MNSKLTRQQGISTLGLIIVLAIVAGAVFFGMQYVPQYMEAGKVDTILESVEKAHHIAPVKNQKDAEDAIAKFLQINNMEDLKDAFKVKEKEYEVVITVDYERDLDLLYEHRTMKYSKSLVLPKK